VVPGSTPIAMGNWRQAYTIVNRVGEDHANRPVECGTLFKFDARIGGARRHARTRRGFCEFDDRSPLLERTPRENSRGPLMVANEPAA
jgi:hypothetical protein